MSDTTNNEARDTSGLLDPEGRPLDQEAENVITQVGNYIQAHPLKTAMIALAIGYLTGRLRLIV